MSRRHLEAPLPPLARRIVEGAADGPEGALLSPLRWLDPGDVDPGELPCPGVERDGLAAALARSNRSWGHPRADERARRLADPETRVVVTGQQPGLLGGPLYTLLKAIAAARWAERCEAAGIPAVALFWVATEDHDYREVAETAVWSSDGLERLELEDVAEELVPVGMRTLGPSVSGILARLAELFPYEPYESWIDRLGRWYRPQARFGEAFSRLLVDLLGERSPLLVDALDPELKERQVPLLSSLVERRDEIASAVQRATDRITEIGASPQVHSDAGEGLLFVLDDGGRRRVLWSGEDSFTLRGDGSRRSIGELLERIEENPSTVSPNVLSRPLIQDAVLGTSLQVLGPSELAYMAQVASLYELLEVTPPALVVRPQALIVEDRHWGVLEEMDLESSMLLEDENGLVRAVADREHMEFLGAARESIEATWERAREPALELDANLERPWEKTLEQIRRGLETFEEKVTAAAATRDEIALRRLHTLSEYCFPGDVPHERVLAAAHFRGRYGEGLVGRLWEELDERPGALQVIAPPES